MAQRIDPLRFEQLAKAARSAHARLKQANADVREAQERVKSAAEAKMQADEALGKYVSHCVGAAD